MAAEFSRLVGGGGHDASRPVVADQHGLALKIGIIALLYRCEECVHIDMQDKSILRHKSFPAWSETLRLHHFSAL